MNHLTFKRKEESVLDKFIQEDPQIKPPKPENLSIENKARQSAQDLNDLVSETLAAVASPALEVNVVLLVTTA